MPPRMNSPSVWEGREVAWMAGVTPTWPQARPLLLLRNRSSTNRIYRKETFQIRKTNSKPV